jgi:hypothetical protein
MKPEYKHTHFELLPEDAPDDFWLITAYNPYGQTADKSRNREADSRLLSDLENTGQKPLRIIGISADESHAEPGWARAISERLAIELGNKFEQDAVFHFHLGRVDLVNCKNGERESIGERRDLIRDPRLVKHFSIYLGSQPGSPLEDKDQQQVRTIVRRYFEGFSIQSLEGWFLDEMEETLCIQIATTKYDDVIHVAEELRSDFKQLGVGILHNGTYLRIREWTDSNELLRAFGLSQKTPDLTRGD